MNVLRGWLGRQVLAMAAGGVRGEYGREGQEVGGRVLARFVAESEQREATAVALGQRSLLSAWPRVFPRLPVERRRRRTKARVRMTT
jgi:hypothetical protein